MISRGAARRGVCAAVDLGAAELVPDPRREAGWTLLVDDVAQSYVDLDDPRHLEFEYVRRMVTVIDVRGRPGAPLSVLHLGGGGFTVPRYVAATRPGSSQLVIERDRALAALVLSTLPLPQRAGIEVRFGDARDTVEALTAAPGFDLIVGDAYVGAQMPRPVSTVEFASAVARLLAPGGLYLLNVADAPPLAFSRVQVATLRAAFADVCVIGEPWLPRGRRFGNVVLAAVREPGDLPLDRLAATALRVPARGRFLHGAALDTFVGGATARRDAGPPRP